MQIAKVKTVKAPNVLIPITSEDKPEISKELQEKWQKVLDLAAKIIGVPSGLITKFHPNELEVFLSSRTENNPLPQNLKLELGLGWYCENVTGSREKTIVPNALQMEDWKENPSVPFNLLSYMGIPLLWPDGEVFGTFCMLDLKEHNYPEIYQELLESLREVIQNDLKSLIDYRRMENDLAHKETLLKEVHHRVKNHFHLLINTLHLQSFLGPESIDTDKLIHDLQSRISAIAMIHDKLYKSISIENIQMGEYLAELAKHIVSTLASKKVEIVSETDSIEIKSEISVPLGIILSELVTNSIKYAFKDESAPKITLIIRKSDDGNIHFCYKDNGPGFSKELNPSESSSLGMTLINHSSQQLQGDFSVSGEGGFTFELNFKV
jgi:two-component sensor histidine kinase